MEEIASSVERFGRYANWSGSSVLGRLVWFCAWLTSQSTSSWLESVLWTVVVRQDTGDSLVPVWLLWIWDMGGRLPGSARCWRYLLGHPSAVQHSLQYTARYVVRTRSLAWLILDRVFLTSAGDRQSAWSLERVSGRDGSSSQACGGGLWWSEWLATDSVVVSAVCEVIVDFWAYDHFAFLMPQTDWLLLFWRLLYLLIWMLHLWSLAAHEPLLSSMAFGLHVWWWSWWLSHHQCTFWCKQSQFQCTPAGLCGCCRWPPL